MVGQNSGVDPRSVLDSALAQLKAQAGSDLHMKVGQTPMIRTKRRLVKLALEPPTEEIMEQLAESLLTEYQRFHFQKEKEFDLAFEHKEFGRYRINIFRRQGLIGMVARVIHDQIPGFEELALPPIFEKLAQMERGMVLVTGASSQGKSTTLASMVDFINRTRECHIVTIEDPIEYVHRDNRSIINQREVGLDTPSFYDALKGVVRQDPDVILVGEMRDAETFQAAVLAAETGHLVFSTMHARDISQVLDRTLGFFPQSHRDQIRLQLAYNLQAITCQRLLRRSGDAGLIPGFEILLFNSTVRKLMADDKMPKMEQAMRNGTEEGMQTFNQALAKLVQEKKVTLEEAIEKSANPEELKLLVKGIILDSGRSILGP